MNTMRRIAFWGGAVWLAGSSLTLGQLEISCRLPHTRLLQYEPLSAQVTVQNNTPAPVVLKEADGAAIFFFDIEESPGRLVERAEGPLLKEPLTVPPREKVTFQVNLLTAYQIRSTGPYAITARIQWDNRVFVSPKVLFDVVPGLEIARLTALAPEAADGGRRVLMLRTLDRNRSDHVFLRIDDGAGSLCYGVHDLGTIIRMNDPLLAMDHTGRIHVLHQSGPTRYTHSVYSADAMPISATFYTSIGGVDPSLVDDEKNGYQPSGVLPYKGDAFIDLSKPLPRPLGERPPRRKR